jgi:hypothetical protein
MRLLTGLPARSKARNFCAISPVEASSKKNKRKLIVIRMRYQINFNFEAKQICEI